MRLGCRFVSCLAFGSFGVPIKSGAAVKVDIDPLVMQSYKTAMCFLTSWLVLAAGEEFHFTPWGIVSGKHNLVLCLRECTNIEASSKRVFLVLLL